MSYDKATHIHQLRGILADHVKEVFVTRKPWSGMEFGKSAVGNMLLGALEDLGCDRKAELDAACKTAGYKP